MVDKEDILAILNRLIEYSLYILIFLLPFSNTAVEICAIVAISCWFLKKLLLGKRRFKLAHTDLNLPLFIFYLISLLSILWSTHPDISIKAFICKLTEYLLLYFIVVETVNERRVVRNMVIALAASASIVCIDSIWQRFVTGLDFIRGYPMFGLEKVEIGGVQYKFTGFDSFMSRTFKGNPITHLVRITGPFKFPNGLATYLLMASFPFASLALFYNKDLRLRIANSILAVLLAYLLFLTYTRGAIISFILALFLMLFLRGTKIFYTISIILVLIVATLVLVLPEDIKKEVGLSELFTYGTSSPHRLKMWTTALRMFMDRPFLGQGLNTFMANYERFKVPNDVVEGVWYAHNCYLQIASEIGIFGLISFLWMIARMVITSLKSWHIINDDFLRYLYLGLFCGIVSFLLHIGVEMSLYSLRLAVLFYFSLGFLMAIKDIGLNYGKV